jgi:hypothetical protein
LSENPSQYQLSVSEAQHISGVVDEAWVAYNAGTDEATRTKATIHQKDLKLASAKQLCRVYAKLIKYNLGISDSAKIDAGIRPLSETRAKIECPQSSPSLMLVTGTPGAQTLQYRDSLAPERRAKPFGATCLQLWVTVAATNAADMSEAKCLGNFTTNPIGVAFEMSERGMQATYWGRWGGKRNQFGQWSLPISMTIAA